MSDSLQPRGLQHASFPVRHHLPGLAQTYVHRVSDAINKHSLLSSIYLVFNLWIIHILLFQLLKYICMFYYLLLLTLCYGYVLFGLQVKGEVTMNTDHSATE